MEAATERKITLCIYLENKNKHNTASICMFKFAYNTYNTYLYSANLRGWTTVTRDFRVIFRN